MTNIHAHFLLHLFLPPNVDGQRHHHPSFLPSFSSSSSNLMCVLVFIGCCYYSKESSHTFWSCVIVMMMMMMLMVVVINYSYTEKSRILAHSCYCLLNLQPKSQNNYSFFLYSFLTINIGQFSKLLFFSIFSLFWFIQAVLGNVVYIIIIIINSKHDLWNREKFHYQINTKNK